MISSHLIHLSHILVCACNAYGMLFSKTPEQAYIVLANLVIIFLGLQLYKGCMLSSHDGGATTKFGQIFILKNPEDVSQYNFEEITVGFSIILQLTRIFFLVFKLDNILF